MLYQTSINLQSVRHTKGKTNTLLVSRHLNIINVTKQSKYPFNISCTYIHMYIHKNITMYPCLATYTYVCNYV